MRQITAPGTVMFQHLGRAERLAVLLPVERLLPVELQSFQSALANADQARRSPRLHIR
jgi:hypothetical protein